MSFEDDIDSVFSSNGEATVAATYAPQGGSVAPVEVVFSKQRTLVSDDGAAYVDETPTAQCKTSDVPGVRSGDTLKVNGDTYTIQAYPDDGRGITTLELSL